MPTLLRPFVFLCAAAALSACSTPMMRTADIGPPTPCDGPGACQIYIEVMSCASDGLRVTPEHVGIAEAKNIQWTILTRDYKFPPDGSSASDGIVVNGAGFARRPGVTGNGKKFIVHDDLSESRNPIKYAVHVVKQDGSECVRYDPYISNR